VRKAAAPNQGQQRTLGAISGLALAKKSAKGGPRFGDPAVAFGPDGAAHFACIHVTGGKRSVEIVSSRDGGKTWEAPMTLPATAPFETIKVGGEPVKIGKLAVRKLVDLSKHDYKLEPNVTITPDNKWVVFRSNMHGRTHVYAAEVTKSK
jgi:hypothetical protein